MRGKQMFEKAVCIVETLSQFSEKAKITLAAFWWIFAICALWRMLAKCRDLRALTHVGKMSRFTHFARHKILAARRFQLFCTPDHEFILTRLSLFIRSTLFTTFGVIKSTPNSIFYTMNAATLLDKFECTIFTWWNVRHWVGGREYKVTQTRDFISVASTEEPLKSTEEPLFSRPK